MTVSLSTLPENPWPQRGVAVHPKKAPRCWVRSVCDRELWDRRTPREPQTRLAHGRGLQMLLARGCPGAGKAKSPRGGGEAGAGCQNHGCPGAYLAFPPLGVGLDPVGDGRGGRGRREGDALYPGNTCLMRDARLAPQAGTRTGVRKHRG